MIDKCMRVQMQRRQKERQEQGNLRSALVRRASTGERGKATKRDKVFLSIDPTKGKEREYNKPRVAGRTPWVTVAVGFNVRGVRTGSYYFLFILVAG